MSANLLPVHLAMSLIFFLVSSAGYAQKIEGLVKNSRGQKIEGASIKLLNSGLGTVSDKEGRFSLTDPDTRSQFILEASYTGYQTRNVAVSQTSGTVTLEIILQEDYLKLDEVVLTGNATATPKRQLGNSISTIKGEETKYTSSGHVSAVLNGRIMGGVVTQNSGDPGGGYSLKLRGVGSVFGSSEPLYIIDGVVIDNGSQNMVNLNMSPNLRYQTGNNRIIDINPHDIERIEVINGPSAAAIYGSRASNGVVQIFTKKGKHKKTTVSFTSSVNHNSLAGKIEVNEYPFRFGRTTPGSRLTEPSERRTMINNYRTDTLVYPGAGPRALSGVLDTTRYSVKRYDDQDQLFQNSWGTDQYLSVSGGGETSKYLISGSYLNNKGILRNTGFKRYGLNINASAELAKWISIGGAVIYSDARSDEMPNNGFQYAPISAMNHTDNVYNIDERDANGKLLAVEYGWVNPLSSIETFELSTETKRTISNVYAQLKPLKDLAVKLLIGLDTYGQEGFSYQERLPYSGVPLTSFPDGYVSTSNLTYLQWTTDITASYKTTFSKSVTSETVTGYSGQTFTTNLQSREGRNLLPFVRTLAAAQNLFTLPVDLRSEQTVYGFFLQETLGYKELFYFTLAGRTDRSSAFDQSSGRFFYPKAGASFSFSSTEFWKNKKISSWFNTLHLRLAFGKAGNLTGIGPYDRFSNTGVINYYGQGGFAPLNRMGNQDIKPEVKTEWETGADLQFSKGRLFAKFNLYNQRIDDIVVNFNWAPSNGYTSRLDNLGSMQNKGFEILAGGVPVSTKSFAWEVSLLFNRNKNKVTRLYQNAPFIGFDINNTQGAMVGYPIGAYYGTYFARNEDGSLLLNNNNGYLLPQVERGDPVNEKPINVNGQPEGTPVRKVLGDPNPDYTATLINTINYKKWNFRVQIDRVAGFEIYNWTSFIRNNIGNGKMAEQELRGDLTRGWVAAIGGLINGPYISEAAVEDGSFTRLREASLSYDWTGLKIVSNMQFILSGRNLFNFTDYQGYDPENNTAGQSIVRGADHFTIPTPRVIQFSVIATFK